VKEGVVGSESEVIQAQDVFLTGGRVLLRSLVPGDLSAWYAWFNDGEVTGAMNKGIFPNTFEAQRDYLRHLMESNTDLQLAITPKDESRLVGVIGIHKIDWLHRRGDISIVVGDRQSWGKGYGTEAIELMVRHGFERMNFYKITAGMWSSNEGSRRSFEKAGFVLEGTLRENYFRGGGYQDEYRYGLLRRDWESRGREEAT
jgi:RimJ/RimL family protein N-acetyltransferase